MMHEIRVQNVDAREQNEAIEKLMKQNEMFPQESEHNENSMAKKRETIEAKEAHSMGNEIMRLLPQFTLAHETSSLSQRLLERHIRITKNDG